MTAMPTLAWLPESIEWSAGRSGEIEVNGVPLSRAVAIVGRAPCYLYDRARITKRVAELRQALSSDVRLSYAVKANPMPALVGHVARLVDGLDVASSGEMRVALDAGVLSKAISFAGPAKRAAELEQAVAAGVLINLESEREIPLLAEFGRRIDQRPRIAVRVNLPFGLRGSGMRMSSGPKQFGIDSEIVPDVLADLARRGLSVEGLHLFPGSQCLNGDAIIEAQSLCYQWALDLRPHLSAPLRSINLGSGFGIPYSTTDRRLTVARVLAHLNELAMRARSDFPGGHLAIELGRYLVGEAGVYVCRVLDRKLSRGHVFLVTDGGMHHHLAASGNFGQVVRRNYPIAINGQTSGAATEQVSIVGPLCTPLDLLGDRVELPCAVEGDLVVIFQSGAYGRSASPRDFLSHPDAAEALF